MAAGASLARIAGAACVSAACIGCAAPRAEGAEPAQAMQGRTLDLQTIVRAARADAARRSGVAPARTSVLRAEAVTWPDSALGCPEPGRLYMQVLVPGWRVRIEAGRDTHDYHASARGGEWFWCAPGRAQEPVDDPRR